MKNMTLGLVGAGRIGAMHAKNVDAIKKEMLRQGIDLQLVLTDVAADHARDVAARLGAGFRTSFTDILESRVDGIIIATGSSTHPDLLLETVNAGIPAFCEKPLATTVPESLAVLHHIKAMDGTVQVGHQRRFDAGYLEAKRAFLAGELGWLHALRAVTCDMAPPPLEFLATSGGIFHDCSVHDFDILRWLTGREIVEVYAQGSNNGDSRIGELGDVDSGLAMVTFDNGMLASVSASRYNGGGHDVRLEIQGSKGSLMVGLDQRIALRSAEVSSTFPEGIPHLTFADRFRAAYRSEIIAFIELILGRRKNPCPPEDAVAASIVAEAAQQSLQSGLPVSVTATSLTL
ncbi:Gfo/Idh/MocA family oxidoreductase [Arthrobacter sp. SLBN-112]|uniref:Gfo/Idh/MocA family protein n=1 Tax=Arthrobacter sp. SLBN-112 TaxID=2768452 RepID=UPI0027AED95A|nr:Gfo/Idh/MocA family oxidoreductase [Arthrobacter sp. SLBN-112]MDQ0799020.1 myo-inositol 2-dehydrogenase/D-chiro-inositol 1-dehydrogenase [Arthrobacter sp. SLBN-112]